MWNAINVLLFAILFYLADAQIRNHPSAKCQLPPEAPKNIQKVINLCQDEIKSALLSEAAELIGNDSRRRKRDTFSDEERRIAGCLLQCVYKKMKAVNSSGFPTMEGLVNLYTEGSTDKEYRLATLQSVHHCVGFAQEKHLKTPQSLQENGKTCDIAFDVFDCVSSRISDYCGQTP